MSLTRNCQSVTLIGNVGREPDARFLPSGTPVTNLSLATNRQYKDGNGQPVKETVWWKIAFFGKLAEIVAEYASKGRPVVVEGFVRADPKTGGPRIWQKQDGTSGASFELIGEGIKFMGSGNGGGSHHQATDEDVEAATSADGWGDDEEGIPL
jgi:single-strand DNA-binding protein